MQQVISYEKPKSRVARVVFWRVVVLGVVLIGGLMTAHYVSSPSVLYISRSQLTTIGIANQQRTIAFSPYVHTLLTQFQPSFSGSSSVDFGRCFGKCYNLPLGTTIYRLSFTFPGDRDPTTAPSPYGGTFVSVPSSATTGSGWADISSQQAHALERAFTVWDVPFLTLG